MSQIPNSKVPVLNPDGSLTLPWRLYLTAPNSSSGTSPDIAALEAAIAAASAQAAQAEADAQTAITDAQTAIGATDDALLTALVSLGQLDGSVDPTGVIPGSYGDSTHVGSFTVNTNGLLTSAASVAISFPTSVSSFNTRTGAVTLEATDIVTADGVTPVAGLPASPTDGQRSFVTDSTVAAAGNFGAIVVGGGSNHVPVYYEAGTPAWRVG
jgi:hypothetical protein